MNQSCHGEPLNYVVLYICTEDSRCRERWKRTSWEEAESRPSVFTNKSIPGPDSGTYTTSRHVSPCQGTVRMKDACAYPFIVQYIIIILLLYKV